MGKVVGRGSSFLAILLMARILGPAVLGLYAIGVATFHVVGLFASLGLEHAVIRFASRFYGRDRDRLNSVIRDSLALTVVTGGIMAVGLYFAASPLALGLFDKPELETVLKIFAPGIFAIALLKVAAAASRVTQRMAYSTWLEDLTQPILFLVLLMVAAAAGRGVVWAVSAQVASLTLAAAAALLVITSLFPGLAVARSGLGVAPGVLLAFAIPTALTNVLGLATLWTDRLLVGYFLPAAAAGLYQAATLPVLVFPIILQAFNSISAPMIADLLESGQPGQLQELFRVSTKWGLYLGLPVVLVLLVFPQATVAALFDARYLAAAGPMVVLALGQLVNLGSGAVGFLLVMSGRQNQWLVLTGGSLGLNIVLNCIWIPRHGLMGAAVATAVAVSTLFVGGLVAVHRGLGLWPYDRRFAKGILAACVTASWLVAWRLAAPSPGPVVLFSLAAIGAVAFAGTLYLLGFDDEDRYLVAAIRSRLG